MDPQITPQETVPPPQLQPAPAPSLMKKLQDVSALIFIFCIGILSAVSVLGVWNLFDRDVISKSVETLALLAFVAIIIIVAGHYVEDRSKSDQTLPEPAHPAFRSIRRSTLAILIASVALLALLGVLAIWQIIVGDIVGKSLASIAVIAFGSFVIVMTCLQREDLPGMRKHAGAGSTIRMLLLILVFGWVLSAFLSLLIR
jgi:hypothetical protein